jgi:monoamine oxidase
MLNRRDFLTRITAISAGALLPIPALAQTMAKKPNGKKILIAGAGIAGLYAADLLQARGFEVEVVEALDRSGGKLLGGSVAGFPFDFGGQGYSKEMNRVTALGKRLGLTRINRPEPGDFFLDGSTLHTGADYDRIRAERMTFDEKAETFYPGLHDSANRAKWQAMSVMDLARDHFTPSGLDYFRTNFSSEWCSLPDEVSFLHFLEIQQAFEGDEADEMAYRYREGFSALTDRLAARLGDRVHLRTRLESVTVVEGGITAVAGGRVMDANALVLAVPLPHVSRIRFAGFDTRELLDSLSSYRGCAVRKVIAVYDRPFWGTKARDGEFSLPCGMSMLDNSDIEKGAYSLAIFLGGPSAKENPGQQAILKRVAEVVGAEALSPIGYHERAWLDDDQLPGGYASNRVPSQTGSGALPTEIVGRIFLAGSETASHFPTYVEGALASAERAADGVARSLNAEFVIT